jgi:hypothetical protein
MPTESSSDRATSYWRNCAPLKVSAFIAFSSTCEPLPRSVDHGDAERRATTHAVQLADVQLRHGTAAPHMLDSHPLTECHPQRAQSIRVGALDSKLLSSTVTLFCQQTGTHGTYRKIKQDVADALLVPNQAGSLGVQAAQLGDN